MLTSGNKATAEAVARKLGIKEVEADVLPRDNNRIVKELTAEGRIVAMAGNGVNDAPLWLRSLLASLWERVPKLRSRALESPW